MNNFNSLRLTWAIHQFGPYAPFRHVQMAVVPPVGIRNQNSQTYCCDKFVFPSLLTSKSHLLKCMNEHLPMLSRGSKMEVNLIHISGQGPQVVLISIAWNSNIFNKTILNYCRQPNTLCSHSIWPKIERLNLASQKRLGVLKSSFQNRF